MKTVKNGRNHSKKFKLKSRQVRRTKGLNCEIMVFTFQSVNLVTVRTEQNALLVVRDHILDPEKHHVPLVDRTPTQEETNKPQVPPNVVRKNKWSSLCFSRVGAYLYGRENS